MMQYGCCVGDISNYRIQKWTTDIKLYTTLRKKPTEPAATQWSALSKSLLFV